MSYSEVPDLVVHDCPLCGRVAVVAAKGCHERRFRIYCAGLAEKTEPACQRQTDWLHSPEAAVVEWDSTKDVPLPLFPTLHCQ